MVGKDDNIGILGAPGAFQPAQQFAEVVIRLGQGLRGAPQTDAVLVLRLVRFRRPKDGNRRAAFRQDVLGENADGVGQAGGVGQRLGRPVAEAGRQFGLQPARQREIGVNGGARNPGGISVGIRIAGGVGISISIRMVQVGVAAGASADGDVFQPAPRQQIGQGGTEQQPAGGAGNIPQHRFQGGDDAGRGVVPAQVSVAGQAVPTGPASGDDAGDIDAGYGGEDGMMRGKGYAAGGKGCQVGHLPGGDLRGLQAVKHDNQHGGAVRHRNYPCGKGQLRQSRRAGGGWRPGPPGRPSVPARQWQPGRRRG